MGGARKEFGGGLGAFAIVLGLPVFIFFLHVVIKFWNWDLFNVENYMSLSLDKLAIYWNEFSPNAYTWQLFLGWNAFHIVLYMFAPGRIVKGQPDPDTGKVLEYPMNGAFAFAFSLVIVFGGYINNLYSPQVLVDNYHRLMLTTMIGSFALAIYLYIRGRFAKDNHMTGDIIYDFYHGIERHPRIGFFDLKYFFEGRPGLTAWSCLSFVFLLAQYDKYGSVSPFMALNAFLHFVYNWDALYYEQGMLTMLDIVFDPFGWMLAFGDLAYVPFLYPLSSLYLIDHSPAYSPLLLTLTIGVAVLGYVGFRLSNQERNDFKLGLLPNAKFIVMKRFDGSSTKYLISGWSSLARRPNYWPDLLNASSYALCTGLSNPIAWVYPITFFGLLTHRQHRLEEKGRLTYKNWKDFVEAVPYRYIPFLI